MKIKFIVLLILTILFVACGSNESDVSPTPQQGTTQGIAEQQTEIFTIVTPLVTATRITQTAEHLQQLMAAHGRHVYFDVISYMPEEAMEMHELILSQFAAGVGPDIFVRDNMHLFQFIENGFLADIYTLMDKHGNREDFFTNVLDSLTVNGQLFHLPMDFGVEFVGINAIAPQSVLNRFNALESISPHEMALIYIDLIENYPHWQEVALVDGLQAHHGFNHELKHHINFLEKTANLSGLDDFLTDIRTGFYDNMRFDASFHFNETEETMIERQGRYLFHRVDASRGAMLALLPYEEEFFTNYVPLTDNSGNFVNRAWGIEVCVSNTANTEISWAFIEQLITDNINDEDFRFLLHMPVARAYFHQALLSAFTMLEMQMELMPLLTSYANAVENAIDELEVFAQGSFTTPVNLFLVPPMVYMGYFTDFIENTTNSSEALANIQNAIETWLNETRVIEPFVYIPEIEDTRPGIYLTVLAPDNHTGVFQQAANAMDAAWQARGKEYAFRILIEDYDYMSMDFTVREGVHQRLNLELMAGGGPDIIVMDGYDIHNFARSGFLMDIYTLIDRYSNRDYFFTQALKAFEIGGGLYMFPTSFGFEYVGVNGSLPQEFLDRFAAYSVITMNELLTFYTDLMQEHEEFSHLNVGTSWSLGMFESVMHSMMGGYIDFDGHANFVQPSFIEAIENLSAFFEGRDSIANAWTTMPLNWTDFSRDRADEIVFIFESEALKSANAFLTNEHPYFINHVPLVDSQGRLLIDIGTAASASTLVWSSLLVTSGADGAVVWEFIEHLLEAYSKPTGRAAVEPRFGLPSSWGNQSLATPIKRSLFEGHIERAVDAALAFPSSNISLTGNAQDVITALHNLNNNPMALLNPMIPQGIWGQHAEDLTNGLITAETAAQRIQNSVSLWLIE